MNDYSGAEKSEWEERFFGLILDLGESQSERYRKQAIELLRAKTIQVPIKNSIGFYKLELFDCKFNFLNFSIIVFSSEGIENAKSINS